jgi:hypothetical protein
MWFCRKGPPGRRWRCPGTHHVLLDRGLGDVNAEFREFADDARRSPAWVRSGHPSDEDPSLLGNRGLAGCSVREASPVVAESAPLPGDDGAGLHEDEDTSPAGPGSGEPGPEEAVGDVDPGSSVAALVDGELVAQGEDLELEGDPRAEAGSEGGEQGEEDSLHGRAQATRPWRRSQCFLDRRPTLGGTPVIPHDSTFSGRTACSPRP